MRAIKATRGGAAVALTLIAAVGAGCGSSDDKGTSKADFAKQANAICARGSKEIKAAAYKAFPGDKQPSGPALTKFVKDTMVPASRKQYDAIKTLDPPKGDADKIGAITDAIEAGSAKAEANPALAVAEGPKSPYAKANKLAHAYGLNSCGS